MLIDALGQLAEDAAHVGHVGEAAGGESLLDGPGNSARCATTLTSVRVSPV